MRRGFYFFSFLVLLQFPNHVYTQVAFPEASENPLWEVFVNGGVPGTFQYKVGGVASICGQEWNKVQEYSSLSQAVRDIGFYRCEDSRVFFRFTVHCDEEPYLIYDFNLQEGDTFTGFTSLAGPNGGLPVEFEVVAVDTLNLDIGDRIRLTLNYSYPPDNVGFTWWTEGVGDHNNPFYVLDYNNSFLEYSLNCFYQDEALVLGFNCENTAGSTPNRLYVDKDASAGNNSGQNWENALVDLQQALFLADAGDTIWVSEGTYFPTLGTDRNASFSLKHGVAVYGGFSGVESALSERNLWQHPTLLSGDIGIENNLLDNVYHVVKALGVDSTALIDGFNIEFGQADGAGSSSNLDNFGGGMLIVGSEVEASSSPRVANCNFRFNTSRSGGGLYLRVSQYDESLPSIEYCKFEQNTSLFFGGGLYVDAALNPNASFVMKKDTFLNNTAIEGGGANLNGLRVVRGDSCVFISNEVTNEGGGVRFFSSTDDVDMHFTDCIFSHNKARAFGGVQFGQTDIGGSLEDTLRFSFDRCSFIENQSSEDIGSALAMFNFSKFLEVELLGSVFEGNYPDDAVFAGFAGDSESIWGIHNCIFRGNAPFSLGGGAINFQATIFAGEKKVATTITNSIFAGNGGAINLSAGLNGQFNTSIINCTFFSNGPYPIAKTWGEVYNDTTWFNNLEISNSIFWEESTLLPGLGSIFYNGDPDALSLYDYKVSNTAVSAIDCSGPGSGEACGEGMVFGVYPEFIDTINSNFQLSACSPLLNLGSNLGLDSLGIITDITGGERIKDGIVDLGAYERAVFSVHVDSITAPKCMGENDGSVAFTLNGTEPHQFSWVTDSSEGEGTEMLTAGNYQFTITDAESCYDTVNVTISEPMAIDVVAIVEPAVQMTGGSITLTEVSGGAPPYNFNWSTGAIGTTISALPAGIYGLTVTDANNCVSEWQYEIILVNTREESLNVNEITLSPNPIAQGERLRLKYSNPMQNTTIRLYHYSGILLEVYKQSVEEIWTTDFPPGVYWLVFATDTGQTFTRKIVIVD